MATDAETPQPERLVPWYAELAASTEISEPLRDALLIATQPAAITQGRVLGAARREQAQRLAEQRTELIERRITRGLIALVTGLVAALIFVSVQAPQFVVIASVGGLAVLVVAVIIVGMASRLVARRK